MSKKVLIIDDEQDVRAFLTELFEDNGYETVAATDGVEGLDLLQSESPDLITLDLAMPNDTGTAFYRKMHRDEKFNKIPIIVVSGLAGRHLAIKKPFAVFDKPIDAEALLDSAKRALAEE
jgi:CheY-like chemotaxis protein